MSRADNARQVATDAMGFFVGQVMKETRGAANPKMVNDVLKRLLSSG